MKLGLTGSGVLAAAGIVAAGVLAWWLLRNRELFDPSKPSNLAYQATSGIVAGVTGGAAAGGEDTVGGLAARVREWLSGDAAAIEALKAGAPPRQANGSAIFTPATEGGEGSPLSGMP